MSATETGDDDPGEYEQLIEWRCSKFENLKNSHGLHLFSRGEALELAEAGANFHLATALARAGCDALTIRKIL